MSISSARQFGGFLAFAASAALLASSGAANAAITLTYSDSGPVGVDAAFEGAGGYLNVVRGLPLVPPALNTALPPIERAVAQVKSGNNLRRGLHQPTAGTGLPVADGGTGVVSALTNVSPVGGNDNDMSNGVGSAFEVKRVGNIITFTLGADTFSTAARASMFDINALEFRIRSEAQNPANSFAYSNLLFTDSSVTNQALAGFSAANGNVLVHLWEGIAPGDFSLRGTMIQSWTTGNRPGGARLATQIKLLDLDPLPSGVVPEPATWAMLIAGFGLVGAAARRRRTIAAAA